MKKEVIQEEEGEKREEEDGIVKEAVKDEEKVE